LKNANEIYFSAARSMRPLEIAHLLQIRDVLPLQNLSARKGWLTVRFSCLGGVYHRTRTASHFRYLNNHIWRTPSPSQLHALLGGLLMAERDSSTNLRVALQDH